jgi:hypothetical protein
MKIGRKLILTLAAFAVAGAMSCGGMEPQDEVGHYIVDLNTNEVVAKYVGHDMYELINNRIPAEHLWKLYPQHVWMVLGDEGPRTETVVQKGRQHFPGHWTQYLDEKKED